MLDVKLLRDDLTRVKARLATRGTEIDWDEFVSIDQQRRDALARIEKLKERKNRLSGEIGKVKKSGGDATVLMREVEEVSATIRKGEEPLAEIEARFENFMRETFYSRRNSRRYLRIAMVYWYPARRI